MNPRDEALAFRRKGSEALRLLSDILHYDPDTGIFVWKRSMPPRGRVGHRAGSTSGHGYRIIRVKGVRYYEHRLAWLFTRGQWPVAGIDHINGNGEDNRICNLREATQAENLQNLPLNPRSTSGIPEASFDKRRGKWQTGIRIDGKRVALGYFDTAEEAGRAYAEAKAKAHTFSPKVRGFE